MKATQKKSARVSTPAAKPTTSASKARFEKGLQLKFGFPMMVKPGGGFGNADRVITEFEYPPSATDAEKVVMAEKLISEFWGDWQLTEFRHAEDWRGVRSRLETTEKKLKAALAMIRDFDLLAVAAEPDFDIPF